MGNFHYIKGGGGGAPATHAADHEAGGSDPITAQNLSSGAAAAGKIMESDGAGAWALIDTPSGGGGGGGGGGSLVHVETKELTADATSVVFTGLDGDADGTYELEFFLPAPGVTTLFELLPNGLATNLSVAFGYAGTSMGDGTTTNGRLASPTGTRIAYGRARIRAKSGQVRMADISFAEMDPAAGNDFHFHAGWLWDETATVISSLEIRADVAGGIKAGAVFRLYKVAEVGGGAGALEHVETKRVSSADQTTVSFTGLDGDAAVEYILECFFPDAGATVQFDLRPNGIATNQYGARDHAGSAGGSTTYTSMPLANLTAGRYTKATHRLRAKSGQPRIMEGQAGVFDPGTASYIFSYASIWNETATPISSLDVVADVAGGIKVGAELRLYRVTELGTVTVI